MLVKGILNYVSSDVVRSSFLSEPKKVVLNYYQLEPKVKLEE